MSKKFLKPFLSICLLLSLFLSLVSCDLLGTKEEEEEIAETQEEVYISSIAVSNESIPASAGAGNVKLEDIILVVTKSNGDCEYLPMKEEYLTLGSRNKLGKIGLQQLDVLYQGCRTQFQILLVDPSIANYSLVVTGGIPVQVNGEDVEVEVGSDGTYRALYPSGTTVVLQWIPEENKEFDYWTKDAVKIDREEETVVEMNGNYVYAAYSKDIVYSVSFITYKENYNIASKNVRKLYASDIAEMTMDNYVFAGWTLTEIDNDRALSGESIPLVSFDKVSENRPTEKYYEVDRNVTFYAVWTPIKLSYSSYTDTTSGESGYKVVGYNGTLTSLEIPSYYDGSKVLAIEKDAFKQSNAKLLKSIYIPETVVSIDEGAFRNCSSLTEIAVSNDSMKFTSTGDVLYNYALTTLLAYPAGKVAQQYTLDNNVTKVSAYAFYGAIIGKINLSKDVTSIGEHAFDSVHIDTLDFSVLSVTKLSAISSYIGENAFSSNLSCMNVGKGEVNAYKRIDGFKDFLSILTDEGNNSSETHTVYTYTYDDAVLLYRLIDGSNLAKYFDNTDQTAEIIGVSRNITSITLPDVLTHGNDEYNVTSIGYYAFRDCIFLENVELPIYLERVCDLAFEDTPWKDTLPNNSIVENDILYKYLGNDEKYTVTGTVERIAEGAFSQNKKIRTVQLSDSLTTISAYAFDGCEKLYKIGDTETLFLKKNLQSIGAYAFRNTALSDISSESGSNLKTISEYAFQNCYYLKTVSFNCPSLTSIDNTAFLGDDSILSFDVTDENGTYFSCDGILYQLTGKSSATLFMYPAGKMKDVFNPSENVKKYLSVKDNTFTILNRQYVITSQGEQYTATDTVDDKNTLSVTKEGEKYYTQPTVTKLGQNSLHNSNIGALYVENGIKTIYPIYIYGLLYVYFENPDFIYRNLFTESVYEPTYVKSSTADLLTFFASDSELMNEKYTTTDFIFFESEHNGSEFLYYYTADNNSCVTLLRSDRTKDSLTVPDTVSVPGMTDVTDKIIAPYSFGGRYVTKIIFGKDTVSLQSYALQNAYSLQSIRFSETDNDGIVSVHKNSFGAYLNNGLLIYIENGLTSSYVNKWNEGETVLTTFLYKDGGVEYYSSRYLIETQPFVTLCYIDDDDGSQVTVSKISGSVSEQDIDAFRTAATKNGYEVGGWLDYTELEHFSVELGENYTIPYNQVLVCEWKAKIYDVYLYVDSDYTVDMDDAVFIAEKSSKNTSVYLVSVEYHSDYQWEIHSTEEKAKTESLTGWRLDGEVISSQGTWSKVLDNRTDVTLSAVLSKRLYTISYGGDSNLTSSVKVEYNSEYTLAVPTKTGYSFAYWYLTDGTETICLTWENGQSRNHWTITSSSNDCYTVLPAWIANEYEVSLYYYNKDDATPYKTVNVTFDDDGYMLDFDINEFTVHGSGEEYSADKAQFFAGWADSDDVIYTDSDGNALRKWDKSQPSKLYAVWPVEVTSFAEIKSEIDNKNTVSLVLMNDITVTNEDSLCSLETPYKGVFNGNGKKITYTYNDTGLDEMSENVYVGLFGCNEGTLKNIKMSAKITRDIAQDVFTGENNVYIGTVCAYNKGIIENVSVDILSYTVTVDTYQTCFYEISDNFKAGLVCAVDEGDTDGQCLYHYDVSTSYWKNATTTVTDLYNQGVWNKEYSSYYVFDSETKTFVAVTVPFDLTKKYYVLKEPDYAFVDIEVVRADAQEGYEEVSVERVEQYSLQWEDYYQTLYYKDVNNVYQRASDEFDDNETYYEYVNHWTTNYLKYFVLKSGSTFTQAPEVFDSTLDYYIMTETEYEDATAEAKADASNGETWALNFSRYYTYDSEQAKYVQVGAPYEQREYYKKTVEVDEMGKVIKTGDIFTDKRFHTGNIIYIDNENK